MTYCPPHHQVQEYEFTALTGEDILQAGDNNLNCGDCFTMPPSATACITVTDNDDSLSGDAHANEWGDDSSWQIADIKVDGALVHDDQKIYAEEYYVLHGDDGKCYYLIEIEVVGSAEGDRDDFFAFYGDVPDAGVTLTVAGKGNISGDWMDYKDLSAGLKWDLDDNGKLTIEAEDMALKGYKVDDVYAASGGEVIRLKKSSGEASITFGADSGTYDLELAYIDENDGEGEIEIWVGDTLIHSISLDQNNNGNGGDWSSISTVKIENIVLNQGDEITLRGTKDAWEFARIDALTFCAKTNTPPTAVDDFGSVTEDGQIALDLLLNDSDDDGDVVTVSLAGGASPSTEITLTTMAGRTAVVTVSATGILSFDAAAGDFQAMKSTDTDSFTLTYEISDGNGGTATADATVTIQGVNDGPVAVDDMYMVPESGATVLNILDNDSDPENDELTVTLLSQPAEGGITLNADGTVTFDPAGDFATLSDGQTATVTFDYQISDGEFTDTATVTVVVEGEGVCEPYPDVTSAATGTLFDGTELTVSLTGPDQTCSDTGSFRLAVDLGDKANETYNVVFVVDVSGSTSQETIDGVPVLDAQIAALQSLTDELMAQGLPDGALTITIVPFNTSADPTFPVDTNGDNIPDTPFFAETFGDDETLSDLDVDAYLNNLASGGETNYFAAVLQATNAVAQLDPTLGQENNIVYFLTDGNPFPEPPAAGQPAFLLQL
ncbi:MAG: Ig-like domain-containing protein, partial [Pseudomonadota bacterium]